MRDVYVSERDGVQRWSQSSFTSSSTVSSSPQIQESFSLRMKRKWYKYLWLIRTSQRGSIHHFTNLTFQSILSLSSPQQNFFTFLWISNVSNIQVFYPSSLSTQRIQSSFNILTSQETRWKSLFWLVISIICLPISIFLAALPIIPSVPLYYNLYIMYVHLCSYISASRLNSIKKNNLIFFHSSQEQLQSYLSTCSPSNNSSSSIFSSWSSIIFSPFASPYFFQLPEIHFIPCEKLNVDKDTYIYTESELSQNEREREWYLSNESQKKLTEKIGEIEIEDYLRNTYSYLERKKRKESGIVYLWNQLKDPFVEMLKSNWQSLRQRRNNNTISNQQQQQQTSNQRIHLTVISDRVE